MTNRPTMAHSKPAMTLAARRTDLDPIRWIVFTLLVTAMSAIAGCGAGDETAPEDGDSMPIPAEGTMSSERKATISAWSATQIAQGGDIGDVEALREILNVDVTGQSGGAGVPSNNLAPPPTTEFDVLGIPTVTMYDPIALRAATGLFAGQVGRSEPDMQNIGIHVISTWELAQLREAEPMPMAARGSQGDIWVIVFDTAEPLTAGGFLPENADELEDLTAESSLAGPDGLTTIYYILTLSSDQRGGQFLAVGKGVLNEQTMWSRADLEAIDTD